MESNNKNYSRRRVTRGSPYTDPEENQNIVALYYPPENRRDAFSGQNVVAQYYPPENRRDAFSGQNVVVKIVVMVNIIHLKSWSKVAQYYQPENLLNAHQLFGDHYRVPPNPWLLSSDLQSLNQHHLSMDPFNTNYLRSRVEFLQQQNLEMEKANENLKVKLDATESKLQLAKNNHTEHLKNSKKKLMSMFNENLELREMVETLDVKRDQYEKENEDLKANGESSLKQQEDKVKFEELQRRWTNLLNASTVLKNCNDELKRVNDDKQKQIELLEKQVNELKMKLTTANTDAKKPHSAKIEMLQKQLQIENDGLKSGMEDLKKKASKDKDDFEAISRSYADELASVNDKIEEANSIIETINSQLETAKMEVELLTNEKLAWKQQLENNRKLNEETTKILQNEIEQKESDNVKLKTENEQLGKLLEDEKLNFDQEQICNDKLVEALKNYKDDLGKVCDDKKKQIQRLEKESKELEKKWMKAKSDAEKLDSAVKASNEQVSSLQDEVKDLKAKIEMLNVDERNLNAENKNLKTRLEANLGIKKDLFTKLKGKLEIALQKNHEKLIQLVEEANAEVDVFEWTFNPQLELQPKPNQHEDDDDDEPPQKKQRMNDDNHKSRPG
ncbi:Cytospin-A [Orchesella cincta]|uniref:Cytospin-A n=1 Tax=Orchesella cincta TaxID=48709 RepID=A0A1D2MYK5_ORCCI|nr:Cytospin-A [Orchesella cincta]